MPIESTTDHTDPLLPGTDLSMPVLSCTLQASSLGVWEGSVFRALITTMLQEGSCPSLFLFFHLSPPKLNPLTADNHHFHSVVRPVSVTAHFLSLSDVDGLGLACTSRDSIGNVQEGLVFQALDIGKVVEAETTWNESLWDRFCSELVVSLCTAPSVCKGA